MAIFFHANAEDIGSGLYFLEMIRDHFQINVIAPEYPGYGIYSHSKSSSIKEIIEDSDAD